MNVDATQDDLLAVAEVLKLAAVLDDRAPAADKPRIAAWAEKIHKHGLHRDDLLDGLQVYYDSPSERAIQIGDLVHHAHQVRRDRNEREAEQQRERRALANDAKAADDMRALAAGAVFGPARERTDRLIAAENALQCVTNKREAIAALREFFAAKAERTAPKRKPRKRRVGT